MYRKFLKALRKTDFFLLVLSVFCFSHVLCSQIKSATAQPRNHHHHPQHHHPQHHHPQHHHLHPSGNSDGTTARTTNKNSQTSSADKLPWNIPEQGIGKHNKDVEQGPCRYKRCGVGRECSVNPASGQAECNCIVNCKNEGKSNKPVCGTDGRLYPSYCDLRRTACLTGAHIFFSHYQPEQQQQQQENHHHHQQHHEKVYHDGRYPHRQKDFSSFGIGDGGRNGSTTYISQKHNNFILSRGDPGANQNPQCFPFVQQAHHHHESHHRYHHHHSHYHYDPDKNPLRDKNHGSLQPQSPLQLSTTLQHSKFSRNDEIHSGEYEYDDNDEQDEHDYQNSRSAISTGTTQTPAIAPAAGTLGENGDDRKDEGETYTKNAYDENEDDYDIDGDGDENDGISRNGNDGGSSRDGRMILRQQQQLEKHHHHHHPYHQDFTVDYPSDILRPQKKRKISSRTTNGRLDSRHISEHGHSDMPPSSYYDFMELSKDGNQEEGMKGETSDFEMKHKMEFSSGKDEHDEMSDKSLYLGDGEKSPETLEPSATTNLAWKMLQQEEISRRKDGDGIRSRNSNNNGHWDDPDKKRSSFVSMGRKTEETDVYDRKSENNFSEKGASSPDAFQSTISHKSGEVTSSGAPSSPRHNVCSPQDYEILKAELFQYDMSKLMNHIKLMTSVSNDAASDDDNDANAVARTRGDADDVGRYPREVGSRGDDGGDAPWSDGHHTSSSPPPPWLNMDEATGPEGDKDILLRHIFNLLDRNHDSILEYIELYKAEMENILQLYSPEKTGCQFRDFLLFDDTDHDGLVHVNEFFSSFSHFYDITMISLDKALETKQTRVIEGDSLVLRCDITGSPPPYIQWKRYGTGLSQLANSGIKSSTPDSELHFSRVHMIHAGPYTCQSPRNSELSQTHIVEVETQPYVIITPKASWKLPGEDVLLICRLVLPIIDSSSVKELATGHSSAAVGSVNWIWLFNGVPLRELPKSDNNNNNKYIFENSSSEDTAGISRLRIQDIYFQDMGSYSCQAENAAGIGSAISSLVVIDPNSKPEVQALHNTNAKQLLVFHRNGLASYSAENCGWLWEIFGDDVLQSYEKKGKEVARAVCDQFHSLCDWGNAVQVSPNYVYSAQPSQNRVLLIDVGAARSVGNVVEIIETCANINRMEYVSYTDQLWIRCKVDHDKRQTVVFNVVENASKGAHHKAIQFPLRWDAPGGEGPVRITEIYLPSHQDGKRNWKDCQLAIVSLSDEQSLRTIDLKTFTYHKNSYLNLTKFSCIPHQIHFSLSCTISIINCLNPQTRTADGPQIVVDGLTHRVRYTTTEIGGVSIVSNDNRILLTEKHVGNNTHLFVQRIGVYEITLVSHFLLSNHYTNIRVVHSTLTGAYASVAKLPKEGNKEVVISLQTGEVQAVDDLFNMVPHNSRASALYPADSAFPLKTDKSVIVMNAETLRPRCKFYEEIPELQSFLTVQS